MNEDIGLACSACDELTGPSSLPLIQLIAHVEQRYDELARQHLPWLQERARQGAGAETSAEALARELDTFAARLAIHLRREGELFLPVARQMAEAGCEPCGESPCRFCTIGQPAFLMETEHEALLELLAKVCAAVDGATEPALAREIAEMAQGFTGLFALENEILMGRLLRLERRMKGLPDLG